METDQQHKAFLLLLAAVTLAFFWLILPFFGAVFWAVILAIVFRPLQRFLEARLGRRRNLAAALSVLACILLAILPVTIIAVSLIGEIAALVQRAQEARILSPEALGGLVERLPRWAQRGIAQLGVTDAASLQEQAAGAFAAAGQVLAAQALYVGQNTLRFLVSLGIMLYVLFFLFRDGPRIGWSIRRALPFTPEVSEALLARFAEVVRATIRGNLIIAIIQGAIGGVTFWILGIPGALLWGTVMVFLSLLPAVGAALVWAPWAAYLLLSGELVGGLVLVAVGVGVIGLIDNLLRPPLVGKETRLPDYLILVSTLGGLALFGINGFVIGPLIAALFVACWTLFRDARAGAAPDAEGATPPARAAAGP
jgi:predicted PurR-regulated permease PerM